MDAKLKEKLKEFAQAGLLQWKKSHKPASIGAQPEPIDAAIKSKALTAWRAKAETIGTVVAKRVGKRIWTQN